MPYLVIYNDQISLQNYPNRPFYRKRTLHFPLSQFLSTFPCEQKPDNFFPINPIPISRNCPPTVHCTEQAKKVNPGKNFRPITRPFFKVKYWNGVYPTYPVQFPGKKKLSAKLVRNSVKGNPALHFPVKGTPALLFPEKGTPALLFSEKGTPALTFSEKGNHAHEITEKGNPALEITEKGNPTQEIAEKGTPALQFSEKVMPAQESSEKGTPALPFAEKGILAQETTKKGIPAQEFSQKVIPAQESSVKDNTTPSFSENYTFAPAIPEKNTSVLPIAPQVVSSPPQFITTKSVWKKHQPSSSQTAFKEALISFLYIKNNLELSVLVDSSIEDLLLCLDDENDDFL